MTISSDVSRIQPPDLDRIREARQARLDSIAQDATLGPAVLSGAEIAQHQAFYNRTVGHIDALQGNLLGRLGLRLPWRRRKDPGHVEGGEAPASPSPQAKQARQAFFGKTMQDYRDWQKMMDVRRKFPTGRIPNDPEVAESNAKLKADRQELLAKIRQDPQGTIADLAASGDLGQVLRMVMFGPGGAEPLDGQLMALVDQLKRTDAKTLGMLNAGMKLAIAQEARAQGDGELAAAMAGDLVGLVIPGTSNVIAYAAKMAHSEAMRQLLAPYSSVGLVIDHQVTYWGERRDQPDSARALQQFRMGEDTVRHAVQRERDPHGDPRDPNPDVGHSY